MARGPAGAERPRADCGQRARPRPGPHAHRPTGGRRPGSPDSADPPQLHGPYPTWTRKIGSRPVTKTLTPQDAERLRPYFDAHRPLPQLITELEALSIQLASSETPRGAQPAQHGNSTQHHPPKPHVPKAR